VLAVDNKMQIFKSTCEELFRSLVPAGPTNGEDLDAIEHYFWGMTNGIAMEIGCRDGTNNTESMSYILEKNLGWSRILIEGNPVYRESLQKNSPNAYSVAAVLCEKRQQVHFIKNNHVSGIAEFMSPHFLEAFNGEVYYAGVPHGNLTSVNWSKLKDRVVVVDCLPLNEILSHIKVHHINFVILDVEVIFNIDYSKIIMVIEFTGRRIVCIKIYRLRHC
jgi:aminoglycoside phosphotransferase family enzyme